MTIEFDKASDMVNFSKSLIIKYFTDIGCNQELINDVVGKFANLQVVEAANEEFNKNAGVNNNSTNLPGAYYIIGKHTIYIHENKKGTYDGEDLHKITHELLHAASNNINIGKAGLEQYYYDEGKLEVDGVTINEAATELIASNILGASYAYTEDMEATIDLILNFLNLDNKIFIEMFLSKECWLNEKNGYTFNSENPYLLRDLVQEFDKRLPRNNKGIFNKEEFISKIYENAIFNSNNVVDIKAIDKHSNKLVEFWYTDCGRNIPARIVDLQDKLEEIVHQNKSL